MAYGNASLLSDRGRAWLGSVEGVPPQQVPARAEMAAKTGLMPFQDALMIKQMADQIRASGDNESPPPNNVMEEKIAMISGRAPSPQQMPPPPQMDGQSGPPQQDPRMQGGLGMLSAPNMNFADGGIVAFAGNNGSQVKPKYPDEFLKVIEPLLAREGGAKTTDIKGDRGGLTRFGISKVNNPDIDVANLTKEKAIEIYYERYWKKTGADRVAVNDPYAAEILMDTAVHSGPNTAVNIYREAAGDPSKMLDIRQRKLDDLAKAESQKKFKSGWDNRIESLREGAPSEVNPEGSVTGPINRTAAAPTAPPSGIGTLPTGTTSGTINRGSVAAPPVAGLPAALPAGAITPQQQRDLDIENDRRMMNRGVGHVAQIPALIGDVGAGIVYNNAATGIERMANAVGVPRIGRAIGVYDPEVNRVEMPKFGDGSNFPMGHAIDKFIAGNQPVTKVPPKERKRIGTEYTGPGRNIFPASATPPPPAGPQVEEVPEKALLDQIDVDAEMKKRGMTDEEKYLARARAAFAGAAQRGSFGDKFATFGNTLAEGLGSLKAADRKTRADLEERASRRQEAIAALGLKQRELDVQEQNYLQQAITGMAGKTAQLEAVRLKAMEGLQFDAKYREQAEIAADKTHPENAVAKKYIADRLKAEMGSIQLALETMNNGMASPGMSMSPAVPYAGR